MSKHWNPNGDVARGRFGGRGRLRPPDAFDQLSQSAWGNPVPVRRHKLPPGAAAGLLLVAAACLGAMFVIDSAFGRPDVFAEELEQDAGAWNAIQAP